MHILINRILLNNHLNNSLSHVHNRHNHVTNSIHKNLLIQGYIWPICIFFTTIHQQLSTCLMAECTYLLLILNRFFFIKLPFPLNYEPFKTINILHIVECIYIFIQTHNFTSLASFNDYLFIKTLNTSCITYKASLAKKNTITKLPWPNVIFLH